MRDVAPTVAKLGAINNVEDVAMLDGGSCQRFETGAGKHAFHEDRQCMRRLVTPFYLMRDE